jgi:DNA-binding NarL/FixJ family response regulator
MHVKVLLADDSEIMLRAIERLLQDHPELEVVGSASDFPETIALAGAVEPDVVVLDLRMAEKANGELLALKGQLTSLRLVAVSAAAPDDTTKKLAAALGADAFVDKMNMYDQLIPAILQQANSTSE